MTAFVRYGPMIRLMRVIIEDFCCIGKADIQLDSQGLVFVSGVNMDSDSASSNGAGKTTIFKAICWCLYGQTVDGDKGDEVIRHGMKQAKVWLHLDVAGQEYVIHRSRKKGKPSLSIMQAGKPVAMVKDDCQKAIIDWTGLDFHAFRNTILYGQNDIVRFADPRTTDGQRKDMLHRILRTEIMQQCHAGVRLQRKELTDLADDIRGKIKTAQAKLEEHDLAGLKKECAAWKGLQDERVEERQAEARELLDQAGTELKTAGRAKGMKLALKGMEGKYQQLEAKEDTWRNIHRLQGEARDERKKVQKEQTTKETTRKGKELQLEALEGDTCPTCRGTLTSGPAADLVKELKGDVSSLLGREEVLLLTLEELDARDERLQADMESENERVEQREAVADQVVEARAELEIVKEAKGRADQLKKEAGQKMDEVEGLLNEVNPWEQQVTDSESKVKIHRSMLKRLKGDVTKVEANLADVEFWVRGFSQQGLPSYILDSVMPYMTERANHYLAILSDGDITMTFATQRTLKSRKGVKDEIDIGWTIEGIDDVTPSGGQQKKMELATDLALMDLVATREGGHIDLLMLDEVLDGLDHEGRARVMILLQELRRERGSVFVISHEPDVSEVFERSIKAQKVNGVTSVETLALAA